ncbi:hypothetical protein CPB83DRAFT_881264 [Crepidotus variabilis]|uniref:Uncharacterized protein n=1 Tax=Crepidotus variabilis TaxID=179855 RepID=A0A9P6EKT7_9AGAR|nr:hypothetical protein CPB83DRAFT_881264 [Crepidotus variabilis]
MRATSYLLAFAAVTLTLILNIVSSKRVDWLVVRYKENAIRTKVTFFYGLAERCQETISQIPTPSGDGKFTYRSYECRPFPQQDYDQCDGDSFCTAWRAAYYIDQVAIGFAALALAGILIGATTHSRRRRVWRSVVGLVLVAALCQIAVFAIITDVFEEAPFPALDTARPALGYIFHFLAWLLNILITLGILVAGVSADAGHAWALGDRGYEPIA